jgi:hypothetical protein
VTTATTPSAARREPELLGQTVVVIAVHLVTNTALTGATYDVDGGEQVVPANTR